MQHRTAYFMRLAMNLKPGVRRPELGLNYSLLTKSALQSCSVFWKPADRNKETNRQTQDRETFFQIPVC